MAFRFCDNDFHSPLRDAITYVVENRTEELTLENFREFVLRGMVAFDSVRRIDDWSIKHCPQYDYARYRKYFEDTLIVTEVTVVNDLESYFEGYIFDKNLMTVFYQGY